MQESSTAGLSLPSERIRIRTDLIVEKVGQGGSLLDARVAFAVMIEIYLDPSRTYPVTATLGAFSKKQTEINSIFCLKASDYNCLSRPTPLRPSIISFRLQITLYVSPFD